MAASTTFERKGSAVIVTIDGAIYSVPSKAFIFPDPRNADIIVISDHCNPQREHEGIRVNVNDVDTEVFTFTDDTPNQNELIEQLTTGFFFDNVVITPEGGIAIALINKTGADSVKGSLVTPGSTNNSVVLAGAAGMKTIGAIYNSGIADGGLVYVVISGVAEVLLEDNTASTAGYWAKTSETQSGRADITNQSPEGGTVQALEDHGQEIGHCIQSVTAGTDKLAKVILHFN
jgi:hypothetical protein